MIISIPHTGTHFLVEFFRPAVGKRKSWHIRTDGSQGEILKQAREAPVVIPLRDPAMNMLSHWSYGRYTSILPLAEDWFFLCGVLAGNLREHCFVPVDAGHNYEGRLSLLERAMEVEGVTMDRSHVEDYARRWEPVGSQGMTEEKEIYQSGNMKAFERVAPAILHALAPLRSFGPFFRHHGYSTFAWE